MNVRIHGSPLRWLPLWFVTACGPGLESQVTSTTGTTAADTSTVTSADSASTGPTSSTDGGPADTGTTTDPLEPDFPEHCSTIEQDCPPGHKCMPWAPDQSDVWSDTKCVEIVPDPRAPGEPCTMEGWGASGEDDCDGTSMCWHLDSQTDEGFCRPFCTGTDADPTCTGECTQCVTTGDGFIDLCFVVCDPLTQDCGDGEACYHAHDTFVCAPDVSPRDWLAGYPCGTPYNTCPAGMACAASFEVPGCENIFGCCTALCPLDGPDPCPGLLPDTTCSPVYPEGGPDDPCVPAQTGWCLG